MATKCAGSGQPPAESERGEVYPRCAVCDREMAAQGRKASRRFDNAWKVTPVHYVARPIEGLS